MQLTMLGVGSSAGTPVLGCACATCRSDNPRNQRTRCSSVLRLDDGKVLLIDTSPDLRQQALREQLLQVDAVLYTHAHADHLHGIDDLRAFCQRQRAQIPLYGNADTMAQIALKFPYALREPSGNWDLPLLKTHIIDAPFRLFDQWIIPIPAQHGYSRVYGYRLGKFAYMTDVSEIPAHSVALLQGLDVLLLDCLRYQPHTTHINLQQSLHYAQLIGAAKTYLIHMTHDLEYTDLSGQLPDAVYAGYDGLTLTL